MDAIGQEHDGTRKEICVENEEMQRAKYQGATITYYKKRGTLCIQEKENIVMKLRDHLAEENEKAVRSDIAEKGTEIGTTNEQAGRKEQNNVETSEEKGIRK